MSLLNTVSLKYNTLTNTLISKYFTISTMESCTSGLIASLISDTQGSSKVLKGSFVSYCNEAKIMCGVNPDIISKYGVYSKETSIAMANTCKEKFISDISIGVTGSFSNVDPNNADSIPGQVDYTIIYFDEVSSYHISLPTDINRFESKLYVANQIYESLITKLNK